MVVLTQESDHMQYIIAIGIFQALVAAGLLWKNKLRNSADDLLILLVACIGTHLGIKFVIYNFVADVQVRYQMNTFIGFCYGPLIYLYALKAGNKAFIPASKWYVFLPFIMGAIAYFTIAGLLFLSHDATAGYHLLKWYNEISFWMLLPADLGFVLLALKATAKYTADLHKEKQLVKRIAICFIIISVLSVAFYIAVQFLGKGYSFFFRSVVYTMLALLSVMIIRYRYAAVSGQTNDNVLKDILPEMESSSAVPEVAVAIVQEEIPSRKTILTEEEQQRTWQQLEERLKKAKLYADSDLNLDKLALATGINKYHISETLNNYAHKTFYQYINEYRIDFALSQIQRLHEQALPVNILLLAYDAGFKAKSSFNRYFKEITGLTPTEYLKSLQQVDLLAKKALG